jgi:hypothetical protein
MSNSDVFDNGNAAPYEASICANPAVFPGTVMMTTINQNGTETVVYVGPIGECPDTAGKKLRMSPQDFDVMKEIVRSKQN